MKLTKDQKKRLTTKIDVLVGKTRGNVTTADVYETADELFPNIDISSKEAAAMLRNSKKTYGY